MTEHFSSEEQPIDKTVEAIPERGSSETEMYVDMLEVEQELAKLLLRVPSIYKENLFLLSDNYLEFVKEEDVTMIKKLTNFLINDQMPGLNLTGQDVWDYHALLKDSEGENSKVKAIINNISANLGAKLAAHHDSNVHL